MRPSATDDRLELAVRVWQEPAAKPSAAEGTTNAPNPTRPRSVVEQWPKAVLVLDTETTIDDRQSLTFGGYRYGRWRADGTIAWREEGLIHADDLATTDPAGFRVLQDYARAEPAEVAPGTRRRELRLRCRRDFLNEVLWPCYRGGTLICGFNLRFDLSRLAFAWSEARRSYAGGFSLALWDYQDKETGERKVNKFRPRLRVKAIDSKRGRMGYAAPSVRDEGDPQDAGRFLDLRTLAFVLSDKSHSLRSAGEAFGAAVLKEAHPEGHGQITAEYVGYCRRDVAATGSLLEALRAEYDRHPVELPPDRAYSPASLAKAYLRAMRLAPALTRQSDVPRDLLGAACAACAAYFGGRAEVRIRRTPVPVVYTDVLSMYPSCQALLGLWAFQTAERIEIVDCTEEAHAFLASVATEQLLEPATWRELTFFAEIRPDGDILPVRARYDAATDAYGIGVNYFSDDEPRWYAGPDLAASVLLTGKSPTVVRAVRLVPVGEQADLQPVALRGIVDVDPRESDFFRRVIEERKRSTTRTELSKGERKRLDKFLKVLANSGSYGILAEQNRQELPAEQPASLTIYGLGEPFPVETRTPEEPGAYCFPPLAALITAAARLVLALIERLVTDLGGVHALCDTDSMAIVATERGGLVPCLGGPLRTPDGRAAVRALTWAQVDGIVATVDRLNPYDRTVVADSLLKIENQNFVPCGIGEHEPDCVCTKQRRQLWTLAISAKRYALHNLDEIGEPVIQKPSEHGLGHLLNPIDLESEECDWIGQLWDGIVREELGLPWERPGWLDAVAVTQISTSSPALMRPFPSSGSYNESVKPFNFLLGAHISPFGHPTGVDPNRFHLVQPFSTNATHWFSRPWTDVYSGDKYRVTTEGTHGGDGIARVQRIADVLDAYLVHPEAKSLGPDGVPCGRATRGLLGRRHVRTGSVVGIGKEANKLEDVEEGLVHDWDDVRLVFRRPRDDPWDATLSVLRALPTRDLAAAVGMSERRLRDVLKGRARPRPRARDKLSWIAAPFARTRFRDRGLPSPGNDLATCTAEKEKAVAT